jgi:hypothetical protein
LCSICKAGSKSVHHLYMECKFAKQVGEDAISLIGGKERWAGDSVESAINSWKDDKEVAEHIALPTVVIWHIWFSRNSVIFRDEEQPPIKTFHRIKFIYKELAKVRLKKERRTRELNIDLSFPWGFFDGASCGNPGACGVGGVLYLSKRARDMLLLWSRNRFKQLGRVKEYFLYYGHSKGERTKSLAIPSWW